MKKIDRRVWVCLILAYVFGLWCDVALAQKGAPASKKKKEVASTTPPGVTQTKVDRLVIYSAEKTKETPKLVTYHPFPQEVSNHPIIFTEITRAADKYNPTDEEVKMNEDGSVDVKTQSAKPMQQQEDLSKPMAPPAEDPIGNELE